MSFMDSPYAMGLRGRSYEYRHSKPRGWRHERVVEHRLREQGMEAFLPTVRETHRWSDRKKTVEVPLFSCYVFVRCALSAEDRTRVFRIESALGFVGTRGTG